MTIARLRLLQFLCLPLLLACLIDEIDAAERVVSDAPLGFRFEQIPTFDEPSDLTYGLAFAINGLGESAGIADDAQLQPRGFVYANGRLRDVRGLYSGADSSLKAINLFGDVAGSAWRRTRIADSEVAIETPTAGPANNLRSLLSEDESVTYLGGIAYAINAAGDVLYDTNRSMVMRADGERSEWGFADGASGYRATAGDLNELRQFVGTARRGSDQLRLHALLQDLLTGEVRDLHDASLAYESTANDINNHGVAVGSWRRLGDFRTVPIRWTDGHAEMLPFLHFISEEGGWIGEALAINDRGDVLGYSARGPQREYWLVLDGQGQAVPLADLIQASFYQAFDRFVAVDINNAREIAGTAVRDDPEAILGSTNKPGLLKPLLPQSFARPLAGLWADPARPGSGIELNRSGEDHYLIWYSYDGHGRPIWYASDSVLLDRGSWRASLYQHHIGANREVQRIRVGQVALTLLAGNELLFHWQLDGRAGTERFSYLLPDCALAENSDSGTWYEPARSGYGLSLLRFSGRWTGVAYLYDDEGAPRWAAVDIPAGSSAAPLMVYQSGSCPGCGNRLPQFQRAGQIRIDSVGARLSHQIDLTADFPGAHLAWQRSALLQKLSSDVVCGR